MIICPSCQTELSLKNSILECRKCFGKIKTSDGIAIFHPDRLELFRDHTSEGLKAIHEIESYHFWWRTRSKYIRRTFEKYVDKGSRFIEIGAGSGNVSRVLKDAGFNVAVGEIQLQGLYWAKEYGIKDLYQFDLTTPVFRDHFDAVGLFDVLEHLENDELVVRSVNSMLKCKGRVIATVPAHKWLWNKRDVLECHKRRYESDELINLFKKNGFKIVVCCHFFVTILPLLIIRKLLSRADVKKPSAKDIEDNVKINFLLNKFLYCLVMCENFLLDKFSPKIGGSIMMIAEKDEERNL